MMKVMCSQVGSDLTSTHPLAWHLIKHADFQASSRPTEPSILEELQKYTCLTSWAIWSLGAVEAAALNPTQKSMCGGRSRACSGDPLEAGLWWEIKTTGGLQPAGPLAHRSEGSGEPLLAWASPCREVCGRTWWWCGGGGHF